MKRLFFLFVLLFVGFGAFGQINTGEYNYNYDTAPTLALIFSLKLQQTMLQDNRSSAVLYSGYGGGFNIGYERRDKLYFYAAVDMDILLSLPPANRQQRESFDNLNILDYPDYDRIRLGPFIAGYSIKNSSHYLGLSFEGQLQSNSYKTYQGYSDFPLFFENTIAYGGLAYVYFGKIWKIPFDVNVNFPMVITPVKVKTPYRNFTDYFNPSLKIDFAPFKPLSSDIGIQLSYACEYLNYYRYRDTRYRYRQVLNSFSISIHYGNIHYN